MNIYTKTFSNQLGFEVIETIKAIDNNLVIIVCTNGMAYADNHISEKERDMVLGSYESNFVEDLNTIDQDILKVTIFDSQGQCFEHVKVLSKYEDNLYIMVRRRELDRYHT